MQLDRSVRWKGLDLKTIEQAHVVGSARDTRLRGVIVAPDFGLFYRIKLDENGHTRTVRIERTDGQVLELFADGAGGWSDDRAEPLPNLRGCIDVDLWPSPITNSLPLWRREWVVGEPQHFFMAWIDGETMTVRRNEQIYTKIDESHWRFANTEGFEALLELDEALLVLNYPGLFARAEDS
jgi:uncharacterized protein